MVTRPDHQAQVSTMTFNYINSIIQVAEFFNKGDSGRKQKQLMQSEKDVG